MKHHNNVRPGYSAINVSAYNGQGLTLQEAYEEFLNRWRWDLYTTNTFRHDIHPEKANKQWRLWVSKMNRHLYGHRWQKRGKGLYWCRVSEFQERGVLHFHGLLGGAGAATLDFRRWQDEWFRLAGQARIETPDCSEAVQRYLTKYLLRGAEIDFGGPFTSEK